MALSPDRPMRFTRIKNKVLIRRIAKVDLTSILKALDQESPSLLTTKITSKGGQLRHRRASGHAISARNGSHGLLSGHSSRRNRQRCRVWQSPASTARRGISRSNTGSQRTFSRRAMFRFYISFVAWAARCEGRRAHALAQRIRVVVWRTHQPS